MTWALYHVGYLGPPPPSYLSSCPLRINTSKCGSCLEVPITAYSTASELRDQQASSIMGPLLGLTLVHIFTCIFFLGTGEWIWSLRCTSLILSERWRNMKELRGDKEGKTWSKYSPYLFSIKNWSHLITMNNFLNIWVLLPFSIFY